LIFCRILLIGHFFSEKQWGNSRKGILRPFLYVAVSARSFLSSRALFSTPTPHTFSLLR